MPALGKLAGEAGGDESRRLANFWREQIKEIEDSVTYKAWYKNSQEIEERYRDERNRSQEFRTKRYNSLWSNIQILQPALYGKCPVPVAERRFKDKDIIGRNAATILERGLRNEIEVNNFHESVSRAVLDYLLSGRGVVWVRYEPIFGDSESLPLPPETDIADEDGDIKTGKEGEDDGETEGETEGEAAGRPGEGEEPLAEEGAETPEGETAEGEAAEEASETEDEEGDEKLEDTGSRILRESVPLDYLHWRDFITLPVRARTWAEVTAVGKRVYMSRDQAKRRFGKKIGKAIPFQRDQRQGNEKTNLASDEPGLESDKCEIFEIWSKQDSHVYWVAEGYDYLCDDMDDPLRLDGFFPVPRPLIANATNGSVVPVPDYIQYRDQAKQIDELSQRIFMLAKACKVAGVYNSAATAIKRLFDEATENQLIPVDAWAAFAENGGVEGNISFIPLKEIMGVLQELMLIKQQQIEEMDRLTGINDILRGTTDARETLGAQRLKTNNTGTRLSSRQDEVARFAREAIRLMAEVMCKHFSPQSLIEVSGALYNEGLGPSDMPPLTELLQMASTGQGGQPGQPPQGAPPQPGQPQPPSQQAGPPGMPPGQPGPQSQMPPGMPPQGQPGTSMVPYQQPGPPGMPGSQPQPQIPWQIQSKLDSLGRIIRAIGLLRDEKLIGFRVDIEVDSTIYGDSEQEKQDRTEFLRATTDFMQQSMMMAQSMPEIVPLLGKFLQFGVRGFKIGRDLESAIEETVEELPQLIQKRMEMGMQNPSPDMIRAQATMIQARAQAGKSDSQHQFEVMRAGAEQAAAQQQLQHEHMRAQAEIARQAIDTQGQQQAQQLDIAKQRNDMMKTQIEAQTAAQQSEIDKQIKLLELQIKLLEMQQAQGDHQHNAMVQQAKTQQTANQIGVEHHKAMAMANQAEVEKQRTQTAAVNAQAAQTRATMPLPANPTPGEGTA